MILGSWPERPRGHAIDAYFREKNQAWRELQDLDSAASMSDDFQADFLLPGCNLGRDDKRSILIANKSSYDQAGVEQTLRAGEPMEFSAVSL